MDFRPTNALISLRLKFLIDKRIYVVEANISITPGIPRDLGDVDVDAVEFVSDPTSITATGWEEEERRLASTRLAVPPSTMTWSSNMKLGLILCMF